MDNRFRGVNGIKPGSYCGDGMVGVKGDEQSEAYREGAGVYEFDYEQWGLWNMSSPRWRDKALIRASEEIREAIRQQRRLNRLAALSVCSAFLSLIIVGFMAYASTL